MQWVISTIRGACKADLHLLVDIFSAFGRIGAGAPTPLAGRTCGQKRRGREDIEGISKYVRLLRFPAP
jgi:hypothetical protein